MESFPARSPAKQPSSSCGFYKYPKSIRSLPELKVLKKKFGPSTQIILEPPKIVRNRSPIFRDLSPRHSYSADNSERSISNFSIITTDTSTIPFRPPLITSFKEVLDNRQPSEFENLLPGHRHASTQTDSQDTDSLDLSDVTVYKSWLKYNVDPFMKVCKYIITL